MRTLAETHIVLFDIDGTLVSSHKSELDERRRYVDAIREVTGRKNPQVNPSRFAGMVDPQICRIILAEAGINEPELESYLPRVLSRMAVAYRKMPKQVTLNRGVKDLLDLLSKSKRHVLGVLTGNISTIAKEKLATAGIDQYFKEGFYADNYDDRNRLVEDAVRECVSKYSLARAKNVIIVGDTPLDMKAARSAHATPIGIASGIYSMETLSLSGATKTFQDLTPTDDLLSSLSFQNSG
jgi:phosphoglycolate phosphatase-like HAD superfamily hydrolase